MGIQVFSQTDNYESQSGLNFQSQSQSPKVCVNPTAHSHSFIIAIGRRRLGYCEQPICLFSAQAHISRAGGGAKLNRETRAVCVFSHGANRAISLIHLNKSTHNSSHTVLSLLSVLFCGVSLQCCNC